MHMHPLQKLHPIAANDKEIDKENFVWRILKIELLGKKSSDYLIVHKPFGYIMYCCLHFQMTLVDSRNFKQYMKR